MIFLLFLNIYFIYWLRWVLVAICEIFSFGMWILLPDQGLNLHPLHWELGVLATEPPGKT